MMHQRKIFLALGAACLMCVQLFVGCQQKWSQDRLTMTTYGTFNNSPGQGWRELAAKSEFKKAAALIQRYIDANSSILEQWEVGILQFHMGQMQACAGTRSLALESIGKAANADISGGAQADFMSYVLATQAFLEGDEAALKAAQASIMKAEKSSANDILRMKIQVLRNRFGSSYRNAWLAAADVAVPTSDLIDELVPHTAG